MTCLPGEGTARKGTVYLVGAGPGSPGLVTVLGLDLARTCDVLVYDNLMADELVALSDAREKIYVGKAGGRHTMSQEEISSILVEKARAGLSVVRLKGGDPFVFGRGGEECQALRAAGVPYVVVPGVTAGIAGPAYAGIPVTHRNTSRGVTLLTGHFSRDESVELPWEALAGLGHTLVFYMAVAALGRVRERLMAAGMGAATPVAIVEQATTGSQRSIVATLGTIEDVAAASGVRPPALLVIGDTVGLGSTLEWMPPLPLAGRVVLFTRAADRDYDAIHRLRDLGAKVIDVPVVRAVPRPVGGEIRSTLERLGELEAVLFTSGAAVGFFFDALRACGRDARALSSSKVIAATSTVRRALEERGIVPDADQGGIAPALDAACVPRHASVLVPRSSAAGRDALHDIEAAGRKARALVVYDTQPADLDWLEVKLADKMPDAVIFLSGSGIAAVLDAAPLLGRASPRPLWACVGRLTARVLVERGFLPDIIPATPDVDLLVDSLIARLAPGR